MRIVVTQDDIDTGIRFHATQCPIARAIIRMFKPLGWFSIGPHRVFITQDTLDYTVLLPSEAASFMLSFDCGRAVQPFAFDIDLPDSFMRTQDEN